MCEEAGNACALPPRRASRASSDVACTEVPPTPVGPVKAGFLIELGGDEVALPGPLVVTEAPQELPKDDCEGCLTTSWQASTNITYYIRCCGGDGSETPEAALARSRLRGTKTRYWRRFRTPLAT